MSGELGRSFIHSHALIRAVALTGVRLARAVWGRRRRERRAEQGRGWLFSEGTLVLTGLGLLLSQLGVLRVANKGL